MISLLCGGIAPVKSKKRRHLPVVMTQYEVRMVLVNLHGIHLIMTKLLYGNRLRLMECVRLRVQDLDLDRNIIYVRAAKGDKDRTTLFPSSLKDDLRRTSPGLNSCMIRILQRDMVKHFYHLHYRGNIRELQKSFAGSMFSHLRSSV